MTKAVMISFLIGLSILVTAPNVRADDKIQIEPPSEELLKTRDPFKRPDIASDKTTPLSEIEKYPIEQLKLLGVVTGPTRMRAMVLAPNGKTYFVAERQKIGVRKGVVRRITSDAVQVRERVINILGREENIDVDIKLGASEVASGSP